MIGEVTETDKKEFIGLFFLYSNFKENYQELFLKEGNLRRKFFSLHPKGYNRTKKFRDYFKINYYFTSDC